MKHPQGREIVLYAVAAFHAHQRRHFAFLLEADDIRGIDGQTNAVGVRVYDFVNDVDEFERSPDGLVRGEYRVGPDREKDSGDTAVEQARNVDVAVGQPLADVNSFDGNPTRRVVMRVDYDRIAVERTYLE